MTRRERGSRLNLALMVFASVTAVGVALMLVTTYLLIRQPFLGLAPLPSGYVIPTLVGFVVGVILFGWGVTRVEREWSFGS